MEKFDSNSIQTFSKPTLIMPMDQMEYEYEIQRLAGVEPNVNFEETRIKAANALKEMDAELYDKSLEDNLVTGGINTDSAVAFDSVYEAPERSPNTSLETLAADNELAEAYTDESSTALFARLNPEVGDDATVKAILYDRFVRRMEDYFNNGSIVTTGAELVAESVPFVANLSEQMPGHFDYLFTSKKDTWDKAFEDAYNKSPEDYARFLDWITANLQSKPKAEAMNMFYRGTETKDYTEDLFTALDVFSLGVSSAPKAAGNVTKHVSNVGEAIKKGSKSAKIKEGLPSAIKGGTLKDMNYNNSVAHQMSDGRYLHVLDDVVDVSKTTPVVHSEEELTILKESAQQKIQKAAAPSLGDPVDYMLTDTIEAGEAGEWLYHAVYGPSQIGEGGGFATEKAATNFAKRLGLSDGSYSIYKAPGDGSGFYVDVVQGLNEEPLRAIKTGTTEEFKTRSGWLGGIQRWLAGSTIRSGEEVSRATEATRKHSVVIDKLHKYLDSIKASKKDEEVVEELYKEGHMLNEGMGDWLSDSALDAKDITDKQKQLYKARKVVNDTSYTILNDAYVREITAQGFGMDDEGMIVREINPSSVTHDMFERMVVRTEAQKLTPNNISGAKALEMIKNGDYKLLEIHSSYINSNLLDYNYKLVPAASFNMKPLPRFIMNYAEGGPRAYAFGNHYIKAGRGWYDGEKFLNSSPITLGAIMDSKVATEAAEDWAKLWDIAKKYGDDLYEHADDIMDALDSAELKHLNVNTPDELADLVRTADNPGGVLDISDIEYRPRLVEGGEEIVYNNGRISLAQSTGLWNEPELVLANNSFKFGKGRRSKLLKDLYQQPARMKSFKEMTERSIQRAANAGVLSDYKRYMETVFRRDYESVVDTMQGRYNPRAMSDTTLIKTAQIVPESSVAGEDMKQLVRSANRFLDVYNNVTNVRTTGDKIIREGMEKAAKAVLKTGLISTERAEKIAETDPSRAIRAIHFNSVMGWWSTAQAWKQTLGAILAFGAHPIDCTRAINAYIPIRAMYKYKDTNPILYKAFRKTASIMGVYNEKALDAFMNFMDQYGTLSAIKRLPGIDEARLNSITNSKMWKSQYFFTEMGTNFNFGVADCMAFMEEWSKKGGKLTKKDMRTIVQRSDDLYGNMSKQTQSKLQNSTVGSWFTQWLSYPMRTMEAVNNRRLTVKEKLGMAFAHMATWGVGGTLLDEETRLNTYSWLTEDVGVDPEVAAIGMNGFGGWLGKLAGVEIQEGIQLLDLLKNQLVVYKLFADQEFVAPQVPAANAPGVIGSTFNAVRDLVFPPTGDFNTVVYLRNRAKDKTLPTGLRNAAKAALMLNIKRVYDNSGEVIKKDATTRDAVLQFLGMRPTEVSEKYYFNLYKDAEEDAISDFVEKLQPYMNQIYAIDTFGKPEQQEENSRKLEELYNRMTEDYNMYLDTVQNAWGSDAANKFINRYTKMVFKDMDEDKLDTLARKIYLKNEKMFKTVTSYTTGEQ